MTTLPDIPRLYTALAEVLAALSTAATLVAASLYIFWEALQRTGEPPEVQSGLMLAVAVADSGRVEVEAAALRDVVVHEFGEAVVS